MTARQPSLKRRLIVKPLIFQLVISLITFATIAAVLLRLDSGGSYADEALTRIAAQAIVRNPQGDLAVRMTPELQRMQRDAPGLWFVAKDDAGRTVSFGQVPSQYASLVAALDEVRYAHLRGGPRELTAVVRQETGPVGPLTVIGHGPITTITWTVALFSNMIVVPIFLVLALVTIVATPVIVNRSLAGLKRIAQEAKNIDANRRGVRLSEAEVPREIEPLVRAVNDALTRLDEDYERQRRFIASAAHELRTPIALLQVKIEASDSATRQQLSATVARLANLAEQLLDLQRMQHDGPKEVVNLADLVRQTAADLAPLLIAAGKSIEVLADQDLPVRVDRGAIERVLTNLVQNAVEHGGNRVIIRVHERSFEVGDDGPGIPESERERVFEEFYRLKPRSSGTGLGLNLVRQVVERHNGRVTLFHAPGGGTIARVELPG
ncbi:sensor histidine kinase [Altererythrobacter xixiisoli]|uniref:histidine kinase n=1 Tax=Croceibacterium xixiisoli TaxID=1476466 RepID=A0A6I4TUN0_9SPHN|nr:HAMP domain-containing sensor histidine kinase [Croceibacterium xixiisoli]MXO98507.1 sensor histidine kinase [Croceibacterium xixiisoli]